VQDDKVEATYVDGVLTVKLPKAVQAAKTKVAIK
jgi:HSP20 family molecular chaperone IbpA